MYCSATDQPWRSLDRFSGFCGDSSTLRLIKDPSNPCFALIMFADDIGVSIGCSVFPAEITGWTPLLCHTFKVARQLHYTQEGAFAWFKTRRTPLLCHALMAAREPGCLGLKHIDIDRREHYLLTAAARHLSRKVWVIELRMQITRGGAWAVPRLIHLSWCEKQYHCCPLPHDSAMLEPRNVLLNCWFTRTGDDGITLTL